MGLGAERVRKLALVRAAGVHDVQPARVPGGVDDSPAVRRPTAGDPAGQPAQSAAVHVDAGDPALTVLEAGEEDPPPVRRPARRLVECWDPTSRRLPLPSADETRMSPRPTSVEDWKTISLPSGDQRACWPSAIRRTLVPSRRTVQMEDSINVLRPVPSRGTIWMSKSLIGGLPGEAPSKATYLRSGERRGRFAFCLVRMIRRGFDPLALIAQIDGQGSSLQKTIVPGRAGAADVPPARRAHAASAVRIQKGDDESRQPSSPALNAMKPPSRISTVSPDPSGRIAQRPAGQL